MTGCCRHLLLAVFWVPLLVVLQGCHSKQEEPSQSQSNTDQTVISQLFAACRKGDIEAAKATLTPNSVTTLEDFFASAQAKGADVGWDQFLISLASFNEPKCEVSGGPGQGRTEVQCTNLGRNFYFAITTTDQQPKIQLSPPTLLQTSTSW